MITYVYHRLGFFFNIKLSLLIICVLQTLDVICKCGFGYDTDFLKSPTSSEDEDGIRSIVSGVREGYLFIYIQSSSSY